MPLSLPSWLTGRRLLGAAAGVVVVIVIVAYIYWLERNSLPVPGAFDGSLKAAQKYCVDLATRSSSLALTHYLVGWGLTLAVVIAAALSLAKVDKVEDRMLLIACVTALGLVARSVLGRADASSELAVAATASQTLDHNGDALAPNGISTVMYNTCAQAWASWLKSRTESSAIARSALEESIKGLKQSAEKATTAAQGEAAQARQVTQSVTNAVSQNTQEVTQKVQEIQAAAQELTKKPNQPQAAARLETLTGELKSTVDKSASETLVTAKEVAGWVLQVGTDTSLAQGCGTIANVRKQGGAPRLYSDGSRTRWMTVLGPVPTKDEAARFRSLPGLRPDVAVIQLPPTWIPTDCGPQATSPPSAQ